MNVFRDFDSFQKLLNFSFRATGYAMSVSMAVFLILAWILTEPLFRAGVYLGDLFHINKVIPK